MENESSQTMEQIQALRNDIIAAFGQSEIAQNTEWESIPFLFMLTDAVLYSSGCGKARRQENYDQFRAAFLDAFSPEEAETFDQRKQLYAKILRGLPLRSERSGGDSSMYGNNSIARLLAAFTDILVDPAAAGDYENAPLILFDEADAEILFAIAFQGVYPRIADFAAALRADAV